MASTPVRTSLPAAALDDAATVKSYKSLRLVERAIRSIKTVDLHVRLVYHWLPERVRAQRWPNRLMRRHGKIRYDEYADLDVAIIVLQPKDQDEE